MKSYHRYHMGYAALAGILFLASAATSLAQVDANYTYYRFTPTALRSAGANSIQLAEFLLINDGATVDYTGMVVTNPGGNTPGGEPPTNVIDGSDETKWLDFNKQGLVFQFPATTTIDAYAFVTANDSPDRDPVSWVIDGSDDGVNWDQLDAVGNYPTTTDRFTLVGNFNLPSMVPALIDSFSIDPVIAANGTVVQFSWSTQFADSVAITELGLVANAGTTGAIVPDDSDSVFTLRATGGGAMPTADAIVRTVVQGEATARFIRFTPVKLRNDAVANSIQLAEFAFFNDGSPVNPVSATSPSGNTPEQEGAANVIDSNVNTKWLDFNKSELVFDFGSPATIDGYSFTTANDADERDPVQWIMESSSNGTDWTLIDNVTAFDFPVTGARFATVQSTPIPLPTTPLPAISTFTGDALTYIPGEPVLLIWSTAGGTTIEIDNAIGTVSASGTMTVMPVGATTYTLTVSNDAGTAFLPLTLTPATSTVTDVAYDDFDIAGDEIALLGAAQIVNDFANIPEPGDANRLRITPDSGSQNGTAWFIKRLDAAGGFDTTFGLHFVSVSGNTGADGMSFMIQNNLTGTATQPANTHENGLPTNSLNIRFDSYSNDGIESAAGISVIAGETVLASVDLDGIPGIDLATTGPGDFTDTIGDTPPYQVRVTYENNLLDIYVDGVLVISDIAVDLSAIGAVNNEGKAYAGFAARTGGAFEAHDVTNWHFSEGPPIPEFDFEVVDFSVDFDNSQVTVTFTSVDTLTYRIVAAVPDLASGFGTPLQENIAGASGASETTVTVPFTPATKLFFRVEIQQDP